MDIRQSIVAIVAESGSEQSFAGTGFIVSGGLILTCAHVIDAAQRDGDMVQFRIEGRKQFFDAQIVFSSPVTELDICVLKPDLLPTDTPPLQLMRSNASKGNRFTVFGYPQPTGFQGLNGEGSILGLARDTQNRDVLQLASNQVTHGFSGCPVWDMKLDAVVGMVSRGFDFGLDKKLGDVAFAIPSEVLKAVYPALKVSSVQQHGSIIVKGNVEKGIVIGNNNVVSETILPENPKEE